MAEDSTNPVGLISPDPMQHPREWRKDEHYLITTDASKIPAAEVNRLLSSPDIYWAKALPEAAVATMLRSGISFGVLDGRLPVGSRLVGMARLVTDHVTFAYLTDVFVEPACRGAGLGRWLVRCIGEVTASMPHLRITLLVTTGWERAVPFYEELLGMRLIEGRRDEDGKGGKGIAVLSAPGRGNVLKMHQDPIA